MSTHHLAGVVPVLATPFNEDGSVDYVSLRRLVEWEIAAGATALAVFGLASEAFALSTTERERILGETVAVASDHGTPVIAGITPTSLPSARERLDEAASGGADVVMVMPPHLIKPSAAQIVDFFGDLAADARAVEVDVMIQDAPGATGVVMDVATLAQCASFDAIRSIKVEAPPTAPKIQTLERLLHGGGVQLLGGQNAQFMLEELASGAIGTMPACEFTDLLVPVFDDWQAGRNDAARDGFAALMPLIVWGLQPGLGWAVHKEVLMARGIIDCAAVRSPATPLPSFSRALLEPVLDRLSIGRSSVAVTS
ncbi:MAG: dihydrodipicolinate synthase family protein [Microbacterium sp.]|uniref:dihydrodipicolinate synthase family protein n=1 Tax=Microbacterium sp. TaxID=51671 RepID=UPI003F80990C